MQLKKFTRTSVESGKYNFKKNLKLADKLNAWLWFDLRSWNSSHCHRDSNSDLVICPFYYLLCSIHTIFQLIAIYYGRSFKIIVYSGDCLDSLAFSLIKVVVASGWYCYL